MILCEDSLPHGVPITATATQDTQRGTDNTDFGDFVSTEDEEVDVEADSEPWYNYYACHHKSPLFPTYSLMGLRRPSKI